MNKSFDKKRLTELCEAALEERLTPEERTDLENMVLSSSEACSFYVRYVAHHVSLTLFFDDIFNESESAGTDVKVSKKSDRSSDSRKSRWRHYIMFPVGLILVLLLFSSWFVVRNYFVPKTSLFSNREVEYGLDNLLTKSTAIENNGLGQFYPVDTNAKLYGSRKSLRDSGRFGVGNLYLESGLMRFDYDNGVILTVEGPAQIYFQNSSNCFLYSGNVYAKVSEEGKGYTINTLDAQIKDLGTEFGVRIKDGEKTDVQVFSGLVNVTPKGRNDIVPITTGGWLRFIKNDDEPRQPLDSYTKSTGGFTCTTKDGESQEICLVCGGKVEELQPRLNSQSVIFTLIKNSVLETWDRKACFSIDLTALPEKYYHQAQLELVFAPTGVGSTLYLPSVSEFTIYGLTDETADFWREDSISWENAPGNVLEPDKVDLSQMIAIDTFTVEGFDEPKKVIINNEALRKFLSSDTNRMVSFIIVRNTKELRQSGYAHGIANRNHPKLPPPTLRFIE